MKNVSLYSLVVDLLLSKILPTHLFVIKSWDKKVAKKVRASYKAPNKHPCNKRGWKRLEFSNEITCKSNLVTKCMSRVSRWCLFVDNGSRHLHNMATCCIVGFCRITVARFLDYSIELILYFIFCSAYLIVIPILRYKNSNWDFQVPGDKTLNLFS